MGEVIAFRHPRGGKSYRVEFVLFEGSKRRQWAVVETEADGCENYLAVSRGRKSEAEAMARLWTNVELRRQRDRELIAADPLGQSILGMSPEQRDFLCQLLQAEKRLRE